MPQQHRRPTSVLIRNASTGSACTPLLTWRRAARLAVAFLVALMLHASTLLAAGGPDRFVPIAPCRLLDTRSTPPADASEQSTRRIDLSAHRCASIVPEAATAYAIRVTSYARNAEANPDAPRPVGALARRPADHPLTFPVAATEHIAVDIEGYYVPPGVALDPTQPAGNSSSTPSESAPPTAAAGTTEPSFPGRRIAPDVIAAGGTYADIYLDASFAGYSGTGALTFVKSAATPWAINSITDAGGLGGFSVWNATNGELFRVANSYSGLVRAMAATAFSGRSDYFETLNNNKNVVHNVSMTNAKDGAGGTTSRVTFFNAQTTTEASSAPTTKFAASTFGDFGGTHINYDSQINYHNPSYTSLYHYRAYSAVESKDTFWVKAATSGTQSTGTRADMYVSGNVGIGTPTAGAQLHVKSAAATNAELRLESADNSQAQTYSFYTLGAQRATMSLANSDSDMVFNNTSTGGRTTYGYQFQTAGMTRLKIDNTGNVGIGTGAGNPTATLDVAGSAKMSGNLNVTGTATFGVIHAQYQDVAEWVPSGERLAAGTVVTIDPAKHNEVIPSSRPYDTSVAGVVSAQPGLVLGQESSSKSQIATTGRVRVHVDATKHAIAAGDLLVTGEKPGTAMYSEPVDLGGVKIHRPGTIIGKALEPLPNGEGEILVLLSLQ